jgi:predicted N-acyltransferase
VVGHPADLGWRVRRAARLCGHRRRQPADGRAAARDARAGRSSALAEVAIGLSSLQRTLQERRRLRQPSGFSIAIADRIALLDAQGWDRATAGQSWFFSRAYLQTIERVPPDAIEPRYALVGDDEGPFAAVVMQWAEVAGSDLRPLARDDDDGPSPLHRLMSKLGSPLKRHWRERVLVCGNLLTYGEHGVAVAPDTDPAAVWPAVAEVLYRVRRAEKLGGQAGFVLIKDVLARSRESIAVLRNVGYREVPTEPNMVLVLQPAWRDHAAYLGAMASKYRSAVKKKILEPIESAGLAVRVFEPDAAHDARMHALYLQVHEKASARPFTLQPGYFAALASAGDERVRCSGIFDEKATMLGFIVTLRDEPQALAYHIGFDRAAAAEHPLYLRLLHASIEQAIALGARELSFGRTALEPKARLGAKPQEVAVWVRHRQPVLNRMLKPLVTLAHHDDAPQCHPFKAE